MVRSIIGQRLFAAAETAHSLFYFSYPPLFLYRLLHMPALLAATNTTLQKLIMSQNKVRDAGAVEFARMLKVNKTLKVLNLRANQIGREGYEELGHALTLNSTLEKILLEFNQIPENDEGASA